MYNNYSMKSNPTVLDQGYLDSLRAKDEIIQKRIKSRQNNYEEQRKRMKEKVAISIETLVTNKADMQKRNEILKTQMREHIENFHRQIAEVYKADDNLRKTKEITLEYLSKNDRDLYSQLAPLIEDSDPSIQSKIFGVKNHAPILMTKDNQLIDLSNEEKRAQNEMDQQAVRDLTSSNMKQKSNYPLISFGKTPS